MYRLCRVDAKISAYIRVVMRYRWIVIFKLKTKKRIMFGPDNVRNTFQLNSSVTATNKKTRMRLCEDAGC